MGRKVGSAVPLSCGGANLTQCVAWAEAYVHTSVPIDILIHPTVWTVTQYTNVQTDTDR